MSKLVKLIGIIAAIGAVGYLFFVFIISPDFDNDQVSLTKDFIENIDDSDICDTHFNPETKTICTTFQTFLKSNTDLTYSLVTVGSLVRITFTDPETLVELEYEFTFVEEANSGIKAFFHPNVYKIDLIE